MHGERSVSGAHASCVRAFVVFLCVRAHGVLWWRSWGVPAACVFVRGLATGGAMQSCDSCCMHIACADSWWFAVVRGVPIGCEARVSGIPSATESLSLVQRPDGSVVHVCSPLPGRDRTRSMQMHMHASHARACAWALSARRRDGTIAGSAVAGPHCRISSGSVVGVSVVHRVFMAGIDGEQAARAWEVASWSARRSWQRRAAASSATRAR